MFLLNGMSRTDARLTPVARLVSPFYYADRSMPLTPGRTFDTGATAGLLVAALVLAGLAAWLMGYRDIGSPLFQRRQNRQAVTYVPARTPWLRIPVLAPLYEQRFTLLAWATGVAISAAYIASIGRTLVNLVKEPGELHAYLALAGRGDPYVAITGYFWFGMLQLMLVAFALASVARWAGEDNDGRLEMQLSAPVPRWRVVVERSVSFLAGAAAIVLLSSAAFYVSGLAGNISFNAGDLAVASLLLLPFVLSFAALGALWTSRAPRTAIAALATVAFLSYLITAGGPLLKWPDWVMKLSAFSLYGTPLTSGAYWAGLWILLAVTLGGFGLAAVLMERREVGR
jgi:ABC-2 type transport system permease protein